MDRARWGQLAAAAAVLLLVAYRSAEQGLGWALTAGLISPVTVLAILAAVGFEFDLQKRRGNVKVDRLFAARWQVLPVLAGVGVMAMIIGAVIVAPREIVQGEVQRLLYIHLSSVAAAYASFTVVFVASVVVLWKKDMRWDAVARGAATVGVLFTAFVLLTGAIWGKPIWGVYWQWDARLTSTLILFLIFTAYLIARAVSDPDDEQTAKYAAVFAIIGFLDIPLIHMSVRWWRTLHPGPTVIRPDPQLPAEMLIVLLVAVIGILALAAWLILLRSEAERVGQRLRRARALIDQREGA